MKTSNRIVRDGISLVGSYHFLLALAALIVSLGIVVYAVVPSWQLPDPGRIQSLFPPLTGLLVSLLLTLLYGSVGVGLMRVRNPARMGAVFLAMFGVVGGLLGVLGTLVGSIGTLVPDWVKIGGIGASALCIYGFLTFVDIVVLGFLLHPRVRSEFYGEEWLPEPGDVEGESWIAEPGAREPAAGAYRNQELASAGD